MDHNDETLNGGRDGSMNDRPHMSLSPAAAAQGVGIGTPDGGTGPDTSIHNDDDAAIALHAAAAERPNQFPWKLYDMLDTAEQRNEEHVISWIRNGTAFKVHDRDVFMEEYMKRMFNQTKYKSFQRQLNLWGFERFQHGVDKGAYFHPLFVKGNRECCALLTRVRLKGDGKQPPVTTTTTTSGKSSSSPSSKSGRGSGSGVALGRLTKNGGADRKRRAPHEPIEPGASRARKLAMEAEYAAATAAATSGAKKKHISGTNGSSSKTSPGESTAASTAMTSTTDGTVPFGSPSSFGGVTASLEVGGPLSSHPSSHPSSSSSAYRYAPAAEQHVADLLQYHAASRQERHRQIAAAAAALGNGTFDFTSPLLPVESNDTHDTTTIRTVDDRLSQVSMEAAAAGVTIEHQERVLNHLNGGSYVDSSSSLHHGHRMLQSQGPPMTGSTTPSMSLDTTSSNHVELSSSSSSTQERRPSHQMLALLAATEQRREEELHLLQQQQEQQQKGKNDQHSSSARTSV